MTNDPIIAALDEQAYDYLSVNAPNMIAAIEEALKSGDGPRDIYRKVLMYAPQHEPLPFAQKCQAAARHMQRFA